MATSWADFVDQLKNAITDSVDVDGTFRVTSITNVDGTTTQYITLDELLDAYERAKSLELEESGAEVVTHRAIVLRRTNFNGC